MSAAVDAQARRPIAALNAVEPSSLAHAPRRAQRSSPGAPTVLGAPVTLADAPVYGPATSNIADVASSSSIDSTRI